MKRLTATKSFIFGATCRLIADKIGISTAQTCGTHCFVGIDHYFIINGLFYSIQIMVHHPLAVVVFSPWNDIAHVTALYSIITVIGHKLVSFVQVTFIITYRG